MNTYDADIGKHLEAEELGRRCLHIFAYDVRRGVGRSPL